MIVEHLRVRQLGYELAKSDELRAPPMPVTVVHRFDSTLDALLDGWAANPNSANDGRRGLVAGVREFAPGFEAEFLTWVRSEAVRPRELLGR